MLKESAADEDVHFGWLLYHLEKRDLVSHFFVDFVVWQLYCISLEISIG